MAGGIQVLRFELRASLDMPLVDHVRGLTRPPTAYGVEDAPAAPKDPGDEASSEQRDAYRTALRAWRDDRLTELYDAGLIVDLGGIGVEAARETIAAHRPPKGTRGRRAKPILDVLIAGPPPRGDDDEWTPKRVEQWGRESLDWLRSRVGPEMAMVTAAVHADETSPHLQALFVPIGGGKLAWKGVRDAAAKRIRDERGPEPGRKSRSFRDAYRTLQDDYQAQVGARYGLERGEVGSEATHAQIDRSKAADHREALARRAAEEAAERERAAVAREAEARREAAEAEGREREAAAALEREREETAALHREARQAQAQLQALREEREREEAVAGGLVTGARSRRGRVIVADYEQQIADRDAELGRVRERVRERDQQIAELRGAHRHEREEADRQLHALKEQVRARDVTIGRLQAQLADLRTKASAAFAHVMGQLRTVLDRLQYCPPVVRALVEAGTDPDVRGDSNPHSRVLQAVEAYHVQADVADAAPAARSRAQDPPRAPAKRPGRGPGTV